MTLPFSLDTLPAMLLARFSAPQRTLSWSINRPGFRVASSIAWIEVRNADLPFGVDPEALVADRLAAIGQAEAVAMITSRPVACHHVAQSSVEGLTARCIATVGLSNGERVGSRQSNPPPLGTINLLLHVDTSLTRGAFVELISLAAMARTAAVMDSGVRRDGVAITGTGTDCIVAAAPARGATSRYAGMHTALGEAAGAAVYQAVSEGARSWRSDFAALLKQKEISG